MLVRSDRKRLPTGWVRLLYQVRDATGPLRPVLYVDEGSGFSASTGICLPAATNGRVSEFILLPDDVRSLRFDPADRPLSFGLDRFEMREVGSIQILIELFKRHRHRWRGALRYLRRMGWQATKQRVLSELRTRRTTDYKTWVDLYDTLTDADVARIRAHTSRLAYTPLISIIMPTYNTPPAHLRSALDSVLGQIYPHWELCVADDASTEAHVLEILQKYAADDERIKVTARHQNGHISAASNTALELATGEFVALLDHDDLLSPHALYMVASELNEHPDAEIIYSDEDKIDEKGKRQDPYFKSDWNPELFYAQNMINHLGVYRASTIRQIGGFRVGYEGSQDYDLALRVIARVTPDKIRHIPHVLYHWRIFSTCGSFSTDNLPQASDAAKRALADFFAGRERVEIVDGAANFWRVVRRVESPPPGVSLIVPTRDRVDLLKGCVEGLLHKTDYPSLEVIIVDNDSVEAETIDYLTSIRSDARVKVVQFSGAFNFSAINNLGVAHATNEIVGLINNDIVVKSSSWLTEMVSHAVRPEVGAVGAKLLYANDTVQHGGVVTGLGGVAGHAHKHFPGHAHGYFARLKLTQNLSCVTAACLVTRRRVLEEVGGFDEANLRVAFNDVDLCLRIRERGYLIVWTPYAELYHLESASRGPDSAAGKVERFGREIEYMKDRWGETLLNDPYYNPNLTLDTENFGLAFPPRAIKPWLCQ